MTNGSNMEFGIRITADGKVAVAEAGKVKESLGDIGNRAEQVNRKVEQSAKQAAFAMRQLPMQMTDIVTGLASGQSPFMVLMQQGGQLKDVFGGIGPAVSAVTGYVAGLINPFTVAAATAGALGYALYKSFYEPQEPAKTLKTAVGDLSSAIGLVGKVSREFSMDSLYKEFNRASAGAREGIIEQIKFQQTLIETQALMAQKSLSKSLDGLGEYTTLDKMKGAFAPTGGEKLARELGVSLDLARDMLPAIKGLRDGTEDAGHFMARFGTELAKSEKGAAQQLIADIKSVAEGSRDAAAAQARLSESLQKMKAAGAGNIDISRKSPIGSLERDPFVDAITEASGVSRDFREKLDALKQGLDAGRVSQEAYVAAVEALIQKQPFAVASLREQNKALEDARKQEQARLDAQWKAVEGNDEEIKRLKDHNAEIGLSAEQLDALRLARMDDVIAIKERQAAVAAATSDDASYIDTLQTQVNQLKEMRGLMGKGQALERSNREAVDMWQSIERAGHDAWNSIGKDGGSVLDSLKRSLKTGIYDLLYQMTVKKWIINIATAISGEGVASQAIGSSGGLIGFISQKLGLGGGGGDSPTGQDYTAWSSAFDWASIGVPVAHSGALIGYEAPAVRHVDPSVFSGSRRYHTGGLAGDEVPAILRRGEGVFTEGQMRKLAPVARSGEPTSIRVEIVNQGSSQQRVASVQPSFDPQGMLVRIFLSDLRDNGPLRQGMAAAGIRGA